MLAAHARSLHHHPAERVTKVGRGVTRRQGEVTEEREGIRVRTCVWAEGARELDDGVRLGAACARGLRVRTRKKIICTVIRSLDFSR